MTPFELVVAVRKQDQRADVVDLPDQEAEDVEGRLVGPVDVLEDDDSRGVWRERSHERADELVELLSRRQRVPEVAVEAVGDIEQRAERPRGEERVAVAEQERGPPALLGGETVEQRRLSDTRLAADD